MIDLKIEYRPNKIEDRDFIFNTWSDNQRSIGYNIRSKKGDFGRFMKHFLMCRMPVFDVLVAANLEFDDQIYGYIVYSEYPEIGKNCLHFLYVKSIYRANQIASTLIEATIKKPDYYSCIPTNEAAKKIVKNSIYNPFLFYASEAEANEFLQSKSCEIRGDN